MKPTQLDLKAIEERVVEQWPLPMNPEEIVALCAALREACEALERALAHWNHNPLNHDLIADEKRCKECRERKRARALLGRVKR